MSFTIIEGKFKPSAGNPDGDSVRFAPNNPALLSTLTRRGRAPRINPANGTTQLRYESIDALESSAINPHASDMTKANLALLGYSTSVSEPPGYILSNQCDTHGRPICFIFTGAPPEPDGEIIRLDTTVLKSSVNYQLIKAGQSYPLFYDTLYKDLREEIAKATVVARTAGLGVWPHDATSTGVDWAGAASLKTMPPIFPKLWRRLQKYTQDPIYRADSDTRANAH